MCFHPLLFATFSCDYLFHKRNCSSKFDMDIISYLCQYWLNSLIQMPSLFEVKQSLKVPEWLTHQMHSCIWSDAGCHGCELIPIVSPVVSILTLWREQYLYTWDISAAGNHEIRWVPLTWPVKLDGLTKRPIPFAITAPENIGQKPQYSRWT